MFLQRLLVRTEHTCYWNGCGIVAFPRAPAQLHSVISSLTHKKACCYYYSVLISLLCLFVSPLQPAGFVLSYNTVIKCRLCDKRCMINASRECKYVWQKKVSESLSCMLYSQTEQVKEKKNLFAILFLSAIFMPRVDIWPGTHLSPLLGKVSIS